jgi:hypothetical protein
MEFVMNGKASDNARIRARAGFVIPGVTEDEIKRVISGEIDLSMDYVLYTRFYNYFADSGLMPYGVMKARTEDPMTWIVNALRSI